jgi:hypothetical protein
MPDYQESDLAGLRQFHQYVAAGIDANAVMRIKFSRLKGADFKS